MPDPTQNPQNPPTAPVPVRSEAFKPPGIIPKNAQTWVILGVSVVMVAAIALSGSGSKGKPAANSPQQTAVIDPNAARIAQYQNQLDEATRKLAAEQATLNQAKQAAAGADPRVAAAIASSTPARSPQLAAPNDRESVRKQLEAERERKEYDSLFASNMALSFRKSLAGVNQIPDRLPEAEARREDASDHRPQANPKGDLTSPDGKRYRLLEGTLLETVLTNRLTGSFAGPVNAMLTTDVYSHDGEHLLIPKGSRILGEVKQVANFGQERLAVVFHRIMPDGYSVSLDQFQGLNQIGETGLRDQVNHHYLQIFGVSIAIGAVAGLSQATTQYGFTVSPMDEYRQGFAASLSESALRILDRFLNILPTLTIREGHRIKIYLASDLSLPAYDGHRVPIDF